MSKLRVDSAIRRWYSGVFATELPKVTIKGMSITDCDISQHQRYKKYRLTFRFCVSEGN